MNAKINDKQKSDDQTTEEQSSKDRSLTKVYSGRKVPAIYYPGQKIVTAEKFMRLIYSSIM